MVHFERERRALNFRRRWRGLACTLPCRRFAGILADANARLGADADRYSFIAVDLHHLLLAGLPAHLLSFVVCGPQETIHRWWR